MKKCIAISMFLICVILFSSCAFGDAGKPDGEIGDQIENPDTDTDGYSRPSPDIYGHYSLVRKEQTYGTGNVLIYPYAVGDEYGNFNTALFNKLLSGIGSVDEAVYSYFNVMCNKDGVLSVVFSYYSMDDSELMLKLPFNYDMAADAEFFIEDCFDSTNTYWRSYIADMVSEQAKTRGMTLIGDVLPVADRTPFYVTSSSIVMMYRPYEIATGSAGWPEFMFSHEMIGSIYDENCPMTRFAQDTRKEKTAE